MIRFLRNIGLGDYISNFIDNHISGSNILVISDSELKDDLQIVSLGHRLQFIKA